MPCLKEERFLLLEHSVTVRPQHDVDTLVARIGQALQLGAPCGGRGRAEQAPSLGLGQAGGPQCGCVRGRSAPYALCGPRGGNGKPQLQQHHRCLPGDDSAAAPGGKKLLCGRGWLRGAAAAAGKEPAPVAEDDDDPHRLLQELLLSGNLIKEAVRRLQLAATLGAAAAAGGGCVAPETVQ